MSGRTGAAFAAHRGSMKANEKIDALRTFGFDTFDVVGIPGGMLVGYFVDIPPVFYSA